MDTAGREDQMVGRGQRQGLALASSGGESLSGHLLGEQLWFGVNLREETVNMYLSVALVIRETSGADGIRGVLWQKLDFTEKRVEEWDNLSPRLGMALDLSLWETISESERSGCCRISRHLPTVVTNSCISLFPAM